MKKISMVLCLLGAILTVGEIIALSFIFCIAFCSESALHNQYHDFGGWIIWSAIALFGLMCHCFITYFGIQKGYIVFSQLVLRICSYIVLTITALFPTACLQDLQYDYGQGVLYWFIWMIVYIIITIATEAINAELSPQPKNEAK
jgi:hypothetical protein